MITKKKRKKEHDLIKRKYEKASESIKFVTSKIQKYLRWYGQF